MRKLLLLVAVLTLGAFASAQQLITFNDLPNNASPFSVPENFAGLHWQGMDAVDALEWADAGAGFFTGNEVMLAFGGGPMCYPNYGGHNNDGTATRDICTATIGAGIGPNAMRSFRPDSAVMAAGWTAGFVTATAYSNGRQVGQQRYNLTNSASRVVFPSTWGQITELKITPGPLGSFVMYTLNIN